MLDSFEFNFTEFITNDVETFNRLSKNVSFDKANFNDMSETSVLRIQWDPKTDLLSVCRGLTQLTTTDAITKRKVLFAVSGIFDPMGFIPPFIKGSRLILKQLWFVKGQIWNAPVSGKIDCLC